MRMSAIALFRKLTKTSMDSPDVELILEEHGEEVVTYPFSGYVLVTLLPYLKKNHQIDLMKSEYDAVARSLSAESGATHFILTYALKADHLAKLQALSIPGEELRDYYNKFNAANEPDAGKPMLEGIRALLEALNRVDDSSVVVLTIS
jgi:hypothetical protein